MNTVKCEEVILCSKETRGKGTEGDPIRIIHQVYSKDGNLISENDPQVLYTKLDMVKFAQFYKSRGESTIPVPTHEYLIQWMEDVDFFHK